MQDEYYYKRISQQEYEQLPEKTGRFEVFGTDQVCRFLDGELHCYDAPARVLYHDNGARAQEHWFNHGARHRTGLPAVTHWDRHGTVTRVQWFEFDLELIRRMQGGVMHCEDAPAFVRLDAKGEVIEQKWFLHGALHRVDGPAVERRSGKHEWFLNGQLHRPGGEPAVCDWDGTLSWYEHGQLHRIGGPAVLKPNGAFEWYHKGKLHREDGPAVQSAGGTKKWYLHGEQMAYKDMPYVQAQRLNKALDAHRKTVGNKNTLPKRPGFGLSL